MERIELSKRLRQVAEYVKPNETMLDIGSDHAHLPIYLVKKNRVPAAIAGEVARQPYKHAKEQIALHGLTDKISIRLGSGFDVLKSDEKVSTTTICGMGGLLIADIIKKGLQDNKITQGVRLVLQPNNNEPALRKILMDQNFVIDKEIMVKENKKYYEIIVAKKQNQKNQYTEEDLIFGPVFLQEKPTSFLEKWKEKYEHNQMILKKIDKQKHQDKFHELTRLTKQIEKVIE